MPGPAVFQEEDTNCARGAGGQGQAKPGKVGQGQITSVLSRIQLRRAFLF